MKTHESKDGRAVNDFELAGASTLPECQEGPPWTPIPEDLVPEALRSRCKGCENVGFGELCAQCIRFGIEDELRRRHWVDRNMLFNITGEDNEANST